jgi:acetoin utilization deacetylase AcuC-like enzyme
MLNVIYSDEFLEHKTGYAHPEKPARLTAIVKALQQVEWQEQINWQLPTPINERSLLPIIEQVHSAEYLARLKRIAETGGGNLDGDTPVSPQSYAVALLAVSAWLDGVDRVLATGEPTFVLARPPGHHATRDMGMGFCLLSNAAIAAYYALQQHGRLSGSSKIERVAILDWDVHHGNGTEAIVEDNPQIAYCSLHQSPCYPGTGSASDRGKYDNVLNIPMNPGSTIDDYQTQFETAVIPFLTDFQPDLLIVSAGYDANELDPLASIALQPSDYSLLTKEVLKITDRHGHLLFGLEGGYHLDALAESVVATLASCL